MEIIKLREEFIKLGQALKAANLVSSGVEAKDVILEGMVKVNGEKEHTREEKNFVREILFLLTEKKLKLKNDN